MCLGSYEGLSDFDWFAQKYGCKRLQYYLNFHILMYEAIIQSIVFHLSSSLALWCKLLFYLSWNEISWIVLADLMLGARITVAWLRFGHEVTKRKPCVCKPKQSFVWTCSYLTVNTLKVEWNHCCVYCILPQLAPIWQALLIYPKKPMLKSLSICFIWVRNAITTAKPIVLLRYQLCFSLALVSMFLHNFKQMRHVINWARQR